MNDWLDYKGSGSARAYAADGLMSNSNISHGLFGIQTKKDLENKQKEADERLADAKFLAETKKSIDKDYAVFDKMSIKLMNDADYISNLHAKASQEKQLASLKPDKDNTHENRYKAMRATVKKLVREFDSDDAEFKKMYEDLNRRIKNWNELNQRINPGEMDKWGMLLSLYNRPFRSVYFDEYR